MTILYLGTIGTAPELATLASYEKEAVKPSVLMSFYFLDQIRQTNEYRYKVVRTYRNMLDSGAYTAKSKNKPIDIGALIKEIKEGGWYEAAALDVIGDPEASYRNAVYMREQGAKCFPTFHFGEPWEYLLTYAKNFDKVGLGGLVPVKNAEERNAWLAECMSRIWPKKTHAFGVMGRDTLMKFPFHSVDSTSWEAGALRFGQYQFMGAVNLGLNRPKARAAAKSEMYLRPESDHYLRLEREVQTRWKAEFQKQGWV
jgi:hypothetical protein